MNWKRCERKRSWPNLRYNSGICPEGLKKTSKICQVAGLGPLFEPRTSIIRRRNPKHSTMMFGVRIKQLETAHMILAIPSKVIVHVPRTVNSV
jgi:hypothetical protein